MFYKVALMVRNGLINIEIDLIDFFLAVKDKFFLNSIVQITK